MKRGLGLDKILPEGLSGLVAPAHRGNWATGDINLTSASSGQRER